MEVRGPALIVKGVSRRPAWLRALVLSVIAAAISGCVDTSQTESPAGVAPGYGYSCYAGFYMCRLPQQVPLGAQCSCPGLGAPSYGTVR